MKNGKAKDEETVKGKMSAAGKAVLDDLWKFTNEVVIPLRELVRRLPNDR